MSEDEIMSLFGANVDSDDLPEGHPSDEEFLKNERIKPARLLHKRPDLNAFLLLDKLVPGDRDMVSGASHDEIYLQVDIEKLAKSAATEEDIIDLIRCGVRYDSDVDGLAMFA